MPSHNERYIIHIKWLIGQFVQARHDFHSGKGHGGSIVLTEHFPWIDAFGLTDSVNQSLNTVGMPKLTIPICYKVYALHGR